MINAIRRTPSFKRDWKKLNAKHANARKLEQAIESIVRNDAKLLRQLHDHALTGQWKGYRELHIEGDWLLIYRIEHDTLTLVLTRTGSHNQPF
ncbi:type II toxin-antitoxin system YafQ family toxin [Bifidobacterium aquikefiricola]|uniref:Type II toxin-antitoxin system YafQ family toxin n=1 Tax=Bifidobacterium aquikefiricola TaxID=3059038 RepID=A0AB39U541_9BIFI